MTQEAQLGIQGDQARIGAFYPHLFPNKDILLPVLLAARPGAAKPPLGLTAPVAVGVVPKHRVHLVVLQPPHRPNRQAQLDAEMHRRVGGLQRPQPQHDAALLQGHEEAQVGRHRGREVVRRARRCLPRRVRLARCRPLEQPGRLGQTLGQRGQRRGNVVCGRCGLAVQQETQQVD